MRRTDGEPSYQGIRSTMLGQAHIARTFRMDRHMSISRESPQVLKGVVLVYPPQNMFEESQMIS